MMAAFSSVLTALRSTSKSTHELGRRFERLIKEIIITDPGLCGEFSDVWLWKDWPHSASKQDTGIDLVAKETRTGLYVAIQCKCFDSEHVLSKEDIDSFFTESGKKFRTDEGLIAFSRRVIFSTTNAWTKHARDALLHQSPPATRVGLNELENAAIDWTAFSLEQFHGLAKQAINTVRPHQARAMDDVLKGFKKASRGKLIMACGTGKTFTSLKISEKIVSDNGYVLFLVPSISLLSQTLREWTAQSERKLNCFVVCSDSRVGKQEEDLSVFDLSYPSTTNAKELIRHLPKRREKGLLNVVFSTYHSVEVVAQAQKLGLPKIDLVICDEAHRTTGVALSESERSHFVAVHDEKKIRANLRLYMTATPRIYTDSAKAKAKESKIECWSMDDETVYGPEFHRLGFSEAVNANLLSDYRVMVLAVDENYVSKAFQGVVANIENELVLNDIVRVVGCWNGLSKKGLPETHGATTMKRAVAFNRTIEDSKTVSNLFKLVVDEIVRRSPGQGSLRCETDHVDGGMNSSERNQKLTWLKNDGPEGTCRILSNARCLSEGVDVPSLDAVMFLNPRNSDVDVVQSVGRVMRRAEGKTYGYIILPIGVPANVTPEEALAENEKYKVVWKVLQALRAHDDRFDAIINKIDLNRERPEQIQIIGVGGEGDGENSQTVTEQLDLDVAFTDLDAWKNAIYAKLVQKCGERTYFDDWAAKVAAAAEHHVRQMKAILKKGNTPAAKAFEAFVSELHCEINPHVSNDEALEMLSQHMALKPVFEALFENYSFAASNPVSKSMQKMLDAFGKDLTKGDEDLKSLYEKIKASVSGVDNYDGKQRVIKDLYDKFFNHAFPKVSERLGIVYTPTEIVDYIVHSVNDVLKAEFETDISTEGVHILDPFTGTGTFVARLLQSGLIRPDDFRRKYLTELHANEIVPLAYYIATINIEEAFHSITGHNYIPFPGAVLTDTFQMSESADKKYDQSSANLDRILKQKKAPISIVIGNPPYSAGQRDENDNNKNLAYPNLDSNIRDTFVKWSSATNKRSLHNSYVRSIRWATTRIGEKGVVALVTNSDFIDGNSADGLRRCLCREYSSIYCFNLRGNQRTSGELSRREGGKVFGSGSRNGVAITVFVKNPEKTSCDVFYYDIGDSITREKKLKIVSTFGTYKKIPWVKVIPNMAADWINQRGGDFQKFIPLSQRSLDDLSGVFLCSSKGILTARDPWVFNFSKTQLMKNVSSTNEFYNSEVNRYQKLPDAERRRLGDISNFISVNKSKISWASGLKESFRKAIKHVVSRKDFWIGNYRPFCKQSVYFNRHWNERTYQMQKIFPSKTSENICIVTTGVGSVKDFSALISHGLIEYKFHENGLVFPLYVYEEKGGKVSKSDGISSMALDAFRNHYGQKLNSEDVFYYVYGMLHSREYKQRFSSELKKMIPRIPFAKNFWAFSKAGRSLAKLHLNYETVKPFPLKEISEKKRAGKTNFKVTKMKFGRKDGKPDKSRIIYNSEIVLDGIPLRAYEYVVNGKSALEWIVDRYEVTVDKDSGIKNDPNEWSSDPRYIIDLIARIVTVSLETMKIVDSLPALEESN